MPRPPHFAALIAAVFDVMPAERAFLPSLGQAWPDYRRHFSVYISELRRAKAVADSWWAGLLESETERVGDAEHAAINVRTRRPGPVVNPTVIGVIRAAWLDCQALNDASPADARVAPVAFVGLWVEQAGHDDLVQFLAPLPFWPVGLDDAGRWT